MDKPNLSMAEQEMAIEPVRLQREGREAEDVVFIPKSLVYAGEKLTHGEFRLMVSILSFSGKLHQNRYKDRYKGCWPGRKRLALMMGISETSVSILSRRLKEKRLLLIKPRGQGKTNLFYPQAPPETWEAGVKEKIELAKREKKEQIERECREGKKVLE